MGRLAAPPSPLRIVEDDVDDMPDLPVFEEPRPQPQRPLSPVSLFRNRLYGQLSYEFAFEVGGEPPEHPLITTATVEEYAAKSEVLRVLSIEHPISEDPFNEAALFVLQWFCADVRRAALLPFDHELKVQFDRSAERMAVVEEVVVAAVRAGQSIEHNVESCFLQP